MDRHRSARKSDDKRSKRSWRVGPVSHCHHVRSRKHRGQYDRQCVCLRQPAPATGFDLRQPAGAHTCRHRGKWLFCRQHPQRGQQEWGMRFAGLHPEISDRFAGIARFTAQTGAPICPARVGLAGLPGAPRLGQRRSDHLCRRSHRPRPIHHRQPLLPHYHREWRSLAPLHGQSPARKERQRKPPAQVPHSPCVTKARFYPSDRASTNIRSHNVDAGTDRLLRGKWLPSPGAGARHIVAVATAAMRDATNGALFAERLRDLGFALRLSAAGRSALWFRRSGERARG